MYPGVVRVQDHKHAFWLSHEILDFCDDRRIGRIPLDQSDKRRKLVVLNRLAVVRPDLDIDPDNPSASHRFAETRVENE